MVILSRKIAVPVVFGVWAVALLVGIHTIAVLPWFTDYTTFMAARRASAIPRWRLRFVTVIHSERCLRSQRWLEAHGS
jgi:hypothetical protein